MDFHSLTRRELQALCKKNKIPANITNAGMADALKALEHVEGIDEFMQQSQSETAQSSIESVEGSEVTSPYVAPTAGRSTRRRNALKEDLGAVTSMTSTRCTTRKTAAKASHESQVDTMETPALVAHTTRRRVQMASACKKMDSQLKECVEEEEKKKDVSMTPAPRGATSQRRRVGESTDQKVYSTRRSVRLGEKIMQMPNDEKSEESEDFNELFTKDNGYQKVDVEEGQQERLGITGVDATDMEERYESKENSEIVSAEEQDIIIGESEMRGAPEEDGCTNFVVEAQQDQEMSDKREFIDATANMENESKEKFEVVSAEEQDIAIAESELDPTPEEECLSFAVEAQGDQDTDFAGGEGMVKPVNVSNEVKLSEGMFHQISEVEIIVDNSKELNVEHVLLESKDSEKEICLEDVQDFNATLVKLTELRMQEEDTKVADDIAEADSDSTDPDETETLQPEESKEAADEEPSDAADNAQKNSEVIVEAAGLRPNKCSAMVGFSDNKENNTLFIMEERNKGGKDNGKSLNELSLRQLTKMFKEKLEITKKSGKEAAPRPALQIIGSK